MSPSEAELVADAAGQLGGQLLRVDADLREQVGVLLGVDLVGELAIGLVGLVVLAAVAQQLDDLVLVSWCAGGQELGAASLAPCEALSLSSSACSCPAC